MFLVLAGVNYLILIAHILFDTRDYFGIIISGGAFIALTVAHKLRGMSDEEEKR